MKNIVIGTAGHVDHGKSSLVKALTGTDPDRLKEEKERGITIDIGFANMDLSNCLHVSFVDVPGHERFVKNMLAGAAGIDAVLLVVAADESIMPQTREHFDICRLLEIRTGLVAISKSDLVEAELVELVRAELQDYLRGSFLEGAPIVSVSSLDRSGLDQLKDAILQIGMSTQPKNAQTVFRLPIDRCFSMRGFGTVVTGTLTSGQLKRDAEVEVYPLQKTTKIRGIQVHGHSVEYAVAGQRVAVNLQNMEVAEIQRGMQLSEPGRFRSSSVLDASVQLLKSSPTSLKGRTPIRFHQGASELMATLTLLDRREILAGSSGYARISLRTPILTIPGDRFVLRRTSPMITIGGGVILDNHPRRSDKRVTTVNFLKAIDSGSVDQLLVGLANLYGRAGVSQSQALERSLHPPELLVQRFVELADQKHLVLLNRNPVQALSRPVFEGLCQQTLEAVRIYHLREPLSDGAPKEQLHSEVFRGSPPNSFKAVIEQLTAEGILVSEHDKVRLAGHQVSLNPGEALNKQRIEEQFLKAAWKVPALEEALSGLEIPREQARGLVQLLLKEEKLVKISEDLWFHAQSISRLRQMLSEYRKQSQTIDVRQFKTLTEVSRKYAIPLLEYLDRERITRRVGDIRVILV
ncbi:MAG TPA: selenocysteine-specific translation elongation factor [Terriglobia bacterium]|nr:selenocysteine-specific translation elongation factor [Terriglobia bacterium]